MPGLATTFSMSSNAQCFAFGHSTGSIHLFTRGDNAQFNEFSEPTLIVEPVSTCYVHNTSTYLLSLACIRLCFMNVLMGF